MNVKHVVSMVKVHDVIHEVLQIMINIYESYVNYECHVPSLREFSRITKVEVVVWDATFTLH